MCIGHVRAVRDERTSIERIDPPVQRRESGRVSTRPVALPVQLLLNLLQLVRPHVPAATHLRLRSAPLRSAFENTSVMRLFPVQSCRFEIVTYCTVLSQEFCSTVQYRLLIRITVMYCTALHCT